MQFLALTTLTLTLVVSAFGQTTEKPGVDYGGACNGLLLQCNRHQETVLCMHREANETVGGDTCSTGLGVTLGRCQCRRNCGSDGMYQEDGEFDAAQDRCVGLVGKTCSLLNTHCTAHSTCNLAAGVCACNAGYTVTPDLRCAPNVPPTTTAAPTTEVPTTPSGLPTRPSTTSSFLLH